MPNPTRAPVYPCTEGRHVHPSWDSTIIGVSLTGDATRFVINCGTDSDPEWFTCCEINALKSRSDDLSNAVPADKVIAGMMPRPWGWVFLLDEWQHTYGKRFGQTGFARFLWDSLWRPLCDINEWHLTRFEDDR